MNNAFDSALYERLESPFAARSSSLRLFGLLGALTLLPVACSGAPPAREAAETRQDDGEQHPYQCPKCRESVRWVYHLKTSPSKVVEHDCPKCNHPWYSFVTGENSCAECAKAHKLCPICAAHGGN